MEDENYDKAYEEYRKLYDITQKESDKEDAPEAKQLAKDKSSLEAADDALNDLALADAEASASKAKANAAKSEKRASEASRILYTTQRVTAAHANVRSGPGKGYPILYVLDRGASVYVIDTQSDSVRTWCNIGDGWISYRTVNGEF